MTSNSSQKKRDFRTLLHNYFEQRVARNPGYSLRAFARDLKISPSRLSDVLKGHYGLSRLAAEHIVERLRLSREDASYFCNLVESVHSRSKMRRQIALQGVEDYERKKSENQLDLDTFKIISDWYHFAIVELTYLEEFSEDPAWIAKTLKITEEAASAAVQRLFKIGLIKRNNGRIQAREGSTFVGKDVPSDAIKAYHSQILHRALEAIYSQSVDERELSSSVVAIDSERINEAKEAIRRFNSDFIKKFCSRFRQDQVYCLSMQFFELSVGLRRPGKKK